MYTKYVQYNYIHIIINIILFFNLKMYYEISICTLYIT